MEKKNYDGMSIEELKELLEKKDVEMEKLKEKKDGGRKKEVLDILIEVGKKGIKIKEIGDRIGISERNVSSQLSYLRKDGYNIGSKSNGNKYLEDEE